MTLYIILAIVILLVVATLFAPLQFTTEFNKQGNKNILSLEIRIYKLLMFRYSNEQKKVKKADAKTEKDINKEKKEKDTNNLLLVIRDIINMARHFMGKVVIKDITFRMVFGTDDAAYTGILTGVTNAVAYSSLAVVSQNFKITNANISIVPVFDREIINISFKSILALRGVHIINIIFKVAKIFLYKIKK